MRNSGIEAFLQEAPVEVPVQSTDHDVRGVEAHIDNGRVLRSGDNVGGVEVGTVLLPCVRILKHRQTSSVQAQRTTAGRQRKKPTT